MDTNEFPNFMNRINRLNRRVRDQETAPRLYAAGIGAGGLRVYDGGTITVRDGGDINVMAGGDVSIGSGGKIQILEGGKIISDGPAVFSGSAVISGNTTINGALSIQKNVTFPDGKLDGSLLKSQFEAKSDDASKSGISAKYSGWRTQINNSISVPSWANDMYALMTGIGYISGTSLTLSKGYALRIGLNGSNSDEGILTQYGAGGTEPARAGGVNAIKRVNVANSSSANATLDVYVPQSIAETISCSLYSTIIFTR